MVVYRPADTARRVKSGRRDRVLLLREDMLPGPSIGVRMRVLSALCAKELQELPQLREGVH